MRMIFGERPVRTYPCRLFVLIDTAEGDPFSIYD
jgi:hypothetical protein